MILDPLADELVARAQAQDTVVERIELHAREPLIEARRGAIARERDR